MKLLLTSAGLQNASIVGALQDLLDKPITQLKLIFISTAANIEAGDKDWLITDFVNCQKAGFASVDILDIASVEKDIWQPRLEAADVLLFGGGDTFYLADQLQKSGVAMVLPELLKTKVYVGISAGSMVASDYILVSATQLFGEEARRPTETKGLGLVNFQFRPHLHSPYFPKVTPELLLKVAGEIDKPLYALDDNSALKVIDGAVVVISEGKWLSYNI